MSKAKILTLIAGAIFLFAAAGTVYALKPSENRKVEIVQDGTLICTLDLSKEKDRTFVIESADGNSSNTVLISDGRICISDAECPDKTCVKTGLLKSEYLPIVCLPNKLVIRFCEE